MINKIALCNLKCNKLLEHLLETDLALKVFHPKTNKNSSSRADKLIIAKSLALVPLGLSLRVQPPDEMTHQLTIKQ